MKKNIGLFVAFHAMMAQTMFDPNTDPKNRFNEDFKHPLVIDPPKEPLKEPFPDCVQKNFDAHTKFKQDNNTMINFERKSFDIDNNKTTIYTISCKPFISYGNQKGRAKKLKKIIAALNNYVRFTSIDDLSKDPFFTITTTHVFN